jgi:hypothetical protein
MSLIAERMSAPATAERRALEEDELSTLPALLGPWVGRVTATEAMVMDGAETDVGSPPVPVPVPAPAPGPLVTA